MSARGDDAAQRARTQIGRGTYRLGAGGYDPNGPDSPFEFHHGVGYGECSSFALWCHRLAKHRPGFNHGPWATVSDDINTDAMIEDAIHQQAVFIPVQIPSTFVHETGLLTGFAPSTPRQGDLVVYRSIWDDPGKHGINDQGYGRRRWIGHVGVIVAVGSKWMPSRWDQLTVVHCHGPNNHSPAVTLSDATHWHLHATQWDPDGKHPLRGAFVLRVKEDVS